MVYILDIVGGRFFTFDAELEEGTSLELEVTKYAIELGGNASDFVAKNPRNYNVSGVVTATPLLGLPSMQRVADALDEVIAIANARQIVQLVAGLWSASAVLTKVDAKRTPETGEALEIAVEAQVVETFVGETTTIPPDLLAPKVKAAVASPGGAGAVVEADGAAKGKGASIAATLADGGSPFEAGAAGLDTLGGLFQ
ncbi:MAG: hypothetical protein COW42_13955 [Deltaproteobacteria bacterium CG17_big_fil_post_rev_8_21_14_2_50_63_7]|nr:MAG: hypothetical protein COW42_13955 [Deltaproteobacteria bacterium CG17_big_fil_post_rev_8_21_14_2_50_63_7]